MLLKLRNALQLLPPKCTTFDFGWGSAPGPLGDLTALPRFLAGFKGITSKGKEGRGMEEEGKGGIRESRGREGGEPPHFYNEVYAYAFHQQSGSAV